MNSQNLSGLAIASGGVALIVVNVVFTPLLTTGIPFPEMMANDTYLWRLSLAALSVFLLMIGSSGLYRHHSEHTGLFGKFSFALAFLGSALLFAHEWSQVFFVHELANIDPAALQQQRGSQVSMKIFPAHHAHRSAETTAPGRLMLAGCPGAKDGSR
jgi:hypothetical protein